MDIFDVAGGNMTDSYFLSNGNNSQRADEKERQKLTKNIKIVRNRQREKQRENRERD